jgi:uncharacterized protein YaaW (UPF0174 family)
MASYDIEDQALNDVLSKGTEEDLAIVADIITDSNKGRLSLNSALRNLLESHKQAGKLQQNWELLANELRRFGGNSIVNLFRRTGVGYSEILDDVAGHMKVKREKADGIEQLELKILMQVAVKAMECMPPEHQQAFVQDISGGKVTALGPAALAGLQATVAASGFSGYVLATTVANAVARQLIGRGLVPVGNAAVLGSIGIFAGPIGWAITAAWAAFDMASPAYRVTVPCVVQIAYMRQKAKVARCSGCGAMLSPTSRFCAECGTKNETHI